MDPACSRKTVRAVLCGGGAGYRKMRLEDEPKI